MKYVRINMPFEQLPSWKEESPVTWEKQQLSKEIKRLRRLPDTDPIIKELQDRYAVLDEPQRIKKQQATKAYFNRVKVE